ncbi:hypothetical protein K443DRAFT_402127 [Laccaria amethystina LaAM-08-1]|uniref:Uncharacterized protein n=1 Tax=Laccaria amethystina LaAM-08-1 TaxID=1095629 RepID=A0A0C9X6W4_9AGAR|nr:hypothetical protein K443DRAFT_553601 [Laccaria amethystina LaAM-08-1]KIJ93371.1 hypothetical protein K443DRAFT_402127 [Laccaria amethystina LaAM-08-1]
MVFDPAPFYSPPHVRFKMTEITEGERSAERRNLTAICGCKRLTIPAQIEVRPTRLPIPTWGTPPIQPRPRICGVGAETALVIPKDRTSTRFGSGCRTSRRWLGEAWLEDSFVPDVVV